MLNQTFKKLFAIFSTTALSLTVAFGQQPEQSGKAKQPRDKSETEQLYVISAKAGNVSLIDGTVRVERAATKKIEVLIKNDELNNRDRVATDNTGKAEILLNPGSFLRLGENTKLEMTDTALDSLKFKLFAGTALFEAAAIGGDGAEVLVATPETIVKLEKSGVYRIKVADDSTEVVVWKGAATVGNELVKAGRKTVLSKGVATTVKFEKKDERDALDVWSKDRAKELAKLNARLQQRTLARAFNGFSAADPWNRFGSGYWVFDRVSSSYCFLPRGFGYWNSPYGYGYNSNIYLGQQTPQIVTPQQNFPANNGAGFPGNNAGTNFPSSGGAPGVPGSPNSQSPVLNSPNSSPRPEMADRPTPGSRVLMKDRPIDQ